MDFRRFMEALSLACAKAEPPIEPSIDTAAKHWTARKEQALLEQGAVLKVVNEEGRGDANAEEGDLVKFHYAVAFESKPSQVIASTREDGKPGVFVLGKKGSLGRLPRGMEIALQSMKEGERSSFTIKPSFGFGHPDCSWTLEGCGTEATLNMDLELVSITKGVCVQVVKEDSVVKETLKDGTGWENPRPPYKVVAEIKVGDRKEEPRPLHFTCGSSAIPELLEEAIGQMFQGEVARIYARECLGSSDLVPASTCPSEGPVALHTYEVSLLEVIQVRDVVGTQEVMKSRVKNGEGEFPIDCPIVDCAMKIRCVGKLKGSGEVFWDTDEEGGGEPFGLETGLNVVPDGLEMCLKLMVPGETSVIQCAPKYAYDDLRSRQDRVAGRVPAGSEVEWEVTLLEFEKPKKLADLPLEEATAEAEQRKRKANALFNSGRFKYAQAKYEELLRDLKALVDTGAMMEAGGESEALGRLAVSCTLNLAACAQRQGQHVEALKHCNKVLEMDPENPKAFYRRGQTHAHLSEWDAARRDYKSMASASEDLKSEADAQLERIDRLERDALQKQKKQFQGFFNR